MSYSLQTSTDTTAPIHIKIKLSQLLNIVSESTIKVAFSNVKEWIQGQLGDKHNDLIDQLSTDCQLLNLYSESTFATPLISLIYDRVVWELMRGSMVSAPPSSISENNGASSPLQNFGDKYIKTIKRTGNKTMDYATLVCICMDDDVENSDCDDSNSDDDDDNYGYAM